MSEEQKKEKLSELRKKGQEIQDILAKKTKELKKICLREAVRGHGVFCTGIVYRCVHSISELRDLTVNVFSGAHRQAAEGVSPLLW